MGLAQRTGAVRVRTGPRDAALREARICYDHLAGERGVGLLDMPAPQELIEGEEDIVLTESGTCLPRRARRGFRSGCTRHAGPSAGSASTGASGAAHLGGALGAALLDLMTERKWLRREEGRVLRFSPGRRRAASKPSWPPDGLNSGQSLI